MDEAVNANPIKALLAAGALCAAHAGAQALEDPTRPPASLMQAAPGGAVPAAPAEPQLQSVLIARQDGGRHVAVIDGQTVRLGESYKGAVLTRMSETEVVLQRGTERQVLKLFPAAHKAAPAAQR
jgi:MSHA biogenesis protein MshK